MYPAFRGYINRILDDLNEGDIKMDGPTNLGLQLQLRKLGVWEEEQCLVNGVPAGCLGWNVKRLEARSFYFG
jgi:hypothetical protein